MRTDFLKAELTGQPFVVHEKILSNAMSALNDKMQSRVASPEGTANNSVEYTTKNNVAVISVDGGMYKKNIGGMCSSIVSYDQIIGAINQAEADEKIDTILFRVDTPGGSVAGVDEVGDRIYNSKKKTVTLFENMGASGGIWAFTASNEVYATESTRLGSIGVIVTFMKDDENKTMTVVSENAENKDCGLNGDCLTKISKTINVYEKMFYARVERNTGFDAEKIKTVFNKGDMIFAQEAKDNGFIKDISNYKDLLESLVANAETVPVIKPVAIIKNIKESGMAGETEDLVAIERARTANIAALGSKYGASIEEIQSAITSGADIASFQAVCLEAMEKKLSNVTATSTAQVEDLQSKLNAAIEKASSDGEATVAHEETNVSEDKKQNAESRANALGVVIVGA